MTIPLIRLARNSPDRACEICDENLRYDHEWSIASNANDGTTLFCSNLKFKERGEVELHTKVWYVNDGYGGRESPASYVHFQAGSQSPPMDRVRNTVLDLEEDIEKGEVRKAKIFTFQEILFQGNEVIHAKLGNWETSYVHINRELEARGLLPIATGMPVPEELEEWYKENEE